VPLGVLAYSTWDDLETRVCGHQVIDVDLLRSITQYQGSLSAESREVKLFWQARGARSGPC
jgi:hypothetical protein